jgi:hypothetical protein
VSDDPRFDDDTSAGKVTQGGHGGRQGHSIWWALFALVAILAALVVAMTLHQTAPAERGTIPVSKTAPARTAPT